MHVLIIADDLTGALDSAVTLVAHGRRAVVARRPADVAAALVLRPDVLAVSTASREGSADDARAAIAATVSAIGELPPIVLKKIDSRLKGHVAAEVAALAGLAGSRRALVAPAIPRLGRFVQSGHVTGAGVERPIPIAAALSGLPDVTVPDTLSEADLDAALETALASDDAAGGTPLLVGAAGLAAALARRLGGTPAERVARLAGPTLFAIGSRDPVTLAQVAALEAAGVPVTAAPNGDCRSGDRFAAQDNVLRLAAAPGVPFDATSAGERFASGIVARLGEGEVGTLLACGGETADAILGALGTGVLEVDGEILPGLPVSTIPVGGRSLRLVTKSGGFGAPDALVSVLDAARALQESAK